MADIQVYMVAGECVPFAKVGGLADVVGALSPALEGLGVQCSVVIPKYRTIDLERHGFTRCPSVPNGSVTLGDLRADFDVFETRLPESSVRVFAIANDHFFGRDGIYLDSATGKDFADQAERWIFFDKAVMDFLRRITPPPDIVHCHDHQTGLIPAYLRRFEQPLGQLQSTRSVFTIHNMGYQGLFPKSSFWKTGFEAADFYPESPFEFFDQVNLMKAGISHANLITTVSPTYAREIQSTSEYGYGLEGVLRNRAADLVGVLNGIDVNAWNPQTDDLIPAHYSVTNLAGKIENKRALLREFGLEPDRMDRPVLAMVSRIDVQKGFDLLYSILDYLFSQDIYFVLLGTGNRETEYYLWTVIERHRDKASIRFNFDNRLAHLTEAGADILLMPSRYEPCGLNQMYSMRYGTVPIVRWTGGLADTVQEFDPQLGTGTGFCFGDYHPYHFGSAIHRALQLWPRKTLWSKLVENGMTKDFSWNVSARRYLELYQRALGREG